MVGDWAIAQLCLFWMAPVAGATIAGAACRFFGAGDEPLEIEKQGGET